MVPFTINQLISISFLLSVIILLYVTVILNYLQRNIKKNEDNYKDLISKSTSIFFDKLNKIELDNKEFELNTKKNIDKRFGFVDKTIESYQQYIERLNNQNRENLFELGKIREKIKVTIGKNKTIEDKLNSIINEKIYKVDSESIINDSEKLTNLNDKFNSIIDEIKLFRESVDLSEAKHNKNNEIMMNSFNELKKHIENQIKTLYGRFNSIDKKTKPIENYAKSEELNKIIFEIDNLKSNFQRLSDEITLEEKISEITIDSVSTQTKILNRNTSEKTEDNIKNFEDSKINFYQIYNNSQKEYYVHKIKELISQEKILIDECKEIEINYKEKYPSSHFNPPDGFCSLKINQHGEIFVSSDTLHLLTHNYNNSNKLIEIVFCKYFIDLIDLDKNFHYYVNNQNVDILEISKFNIRPDIPLIISNDSDFVELENYCLKGIYYIMQRRKIVLERFNTVNKKILYNC